jgi:hypothetical protein
VVLWKVGSCKGGWVVLWKVGSCKGGCSFLPVEADKPRCCIIFSIIDEETRELVLPSSRCW